MPNSKPTVLSRILRCVSRVTILISSRNNFLRRKSGACNWIAVTGSFPSASLHGKPPAHLHYGFFLLLAIAGSQSACRAEQDAASAFRAGDYNTAVALWQVEAGQGDTDAQYRLGVMYYLGLGVEQNNHRALQLYTAAARAGHAAAQRDLGMMYESGRAGVRDMEQAYMWLYAAYQQGNPHAEAGLKMLSGQLSPNRVHHLKQAVRPYIVNDSIDPEDDDY